MSNHIKSNWKMVCPGAWERQDGTSVVVDKTEPAPFQMCRYKVTYGKESAILITDGQSEALKRADTIFPLMLEKSTLSMSVTGVLELIETHNANIAEFEQFCKKLDEINKGGFPANKWFQLYQSVPSFAKHARVIVQAARSAGVDAKYSGQDGKINVCGCLKKVAPCSFCIEAVHVLGVALGSEKNIDIRLDPGNAQIDVLYIAEDVDCSVDINYCPFCGKELRRNLA